MNSSQDIKLKQTKITDFYGFQKSLNLCTVCGIDLGEQNPRQYCNKGYCPKQYIFDNKK